MGEAERSPDRLVLDKEMWRCAETAFAIEGRDMQMIGLWHSCVSRIQDLKRLLPWARWFAEQVAAAFLRVLPRQPEEIITHPRRCACDNGDLDR
jgi:hypothetical protein